MENSPSAGTASTVTLTTTVTIGRNEREKMMVAAAMTAAHYLDAALKAGMRNDQIETVLAAIVQRSGISEFWITDEHGRIVLGSAEMDFAFPTDPDGDSQAAPFAQLLRGRETVVIQDPAPRALDGRVFQYVGVAGVDCPRIIQVGAAAEVA